MYQKLVPNLFLILVDSLKFSQCIRETLLLVKYFERSLLKILKNLIYFFSNPVPRYEHDEKGDLELGVLSYVAKYVQKFSFFSDPLPGQ